MARAGLALVLVLGLGACTAETADDTSSGGISRGAGSQLATPDVKLESFEQVGTAGFAEQKGVLLITNNSSEASDYYVELNIEDANGVVLDFTNAVVNNLQPGASARAEFSSFSDGAARAVVTEVQRTASL